MAEEMGRPEYTAEDYQKWLEDLRPFLKLGETLGEAIDDAGLQKHRTTLYEKYKLKDEFSYWIDTWRAYPGKLAHGVLVKFVIQADEKIKQGIPVSEDEMKNVRFFAEKSRAAQKYFVNRTETAEGKTVEEVLGELDNDADTGHDTVADEAAKQVVEANPPVQDQNQVGGDSNIQAEPNPVATPSPDQGA